MEEFGIDLQQDDYMYHGRCPIHDGDNRTAFNLYKGGDTRPGYWCCWTKHCERKFKSTPIGFVRGILTKDNKDISFDQTINWICNFLGQPIGGIKVDHAQTEQRDFCSLVRKINKTVPTAEKGISRLEVRRKLDIPARFFLERQYPAEILDRFDVGYCADMTKPMGGRVVIPVYDESKLFCVASSGRSIHARCNKCGMHHAKAAECPHKDPYKNLRFSKWRHSGAINSYLYNYWNAKPVIKKTGTVVIVEGPGDVWRLVQYGVENVVALTGNALSDSQQIILEMSGASTVIDLLDNDEAGKVGSAQLKSKLGLYMRLVKPVFSGKDVGEMSQEQFAAQLKPTIERYS